MSAEKIREGFDVFLHDGEHTFGAVRRVSAHDIAIYIENSGDFIVPMSAVQDVHDEKVVLNSGKIDEALKDAIARAHKGAYPKI